MIETRSAPKPTSKFKQSYDFSQVLDHIAHWLPTQAPLKDFIHHNTLHAFQEYSFHQGLHVASHLYGSQNYLTLREYQQRFHRGEITLAALDRSMAREGVPAEARRALRERLLLDQETVIPPGIAEYRLRKRWQSERQVDLNSLVHPILFRILSNYFDQGVSIWRMPHAGDTLWNAVRRLIRESYLPFPPLSDPACQEILLMESQEAIFLLLEKIVGESEHHESYLLEMLLSHAGWSGMVRMAEQNPGSLLVTRPLTLQDAIAVELLLEFGWLNRVLGPSFSPVVKAGEAIPPLPIYESPKWSETHRMQTMWQEAFEWTLYEETLSTLEAAAKRRVEIVEKPSAQIFFCIDDRECSIRRYLEEADPTIETLAVPGFFGIDWMFQSATSGYATKLCPAPVQPRHLVRERNDSATPQRPRFFQWTHLSKSKLLFRGLFIGQVLGVWHALRLAWEVFSPSGHRPTDQSLSHIEPQGELQLLRTGEEKDENGFYLGFSFEEMIERVYQVLRNGGCTKNFADLVLIVAHGASSVNNPYFAAYDCGACSGRPGAPNARAFAWMANHPKVREGVAVKGLVIPPSTHFVGAMHDTTRDEVTYFAVDEVPESHRAAFEKLKATIETSLLKNARERCRRFELAGKPTERQAMEHVRERSASIFEPRPEYNHASVALCIVGRRSLTRGVFLDRRAFLNSYDPMNDPTGTILATILSAAVPVCGGISLEYYFSRVDPVVYGAGSKLPHNVVGLVGVSNGVEGDLLTGLPSQMTEIHDPVRLLVVVEQTPEITLAAIKMREPVYEWIRLQWVRFACLSPVDGKSYLFHGERFVEALEGAVTPPPVQPDSHAASLGHRGNAPLAFIQKGPSL